MNPLNKNSSAVSLNFEVIEVPRRFSQKFSLLSQRAGVFPLTAFGMVVLIKFLANLYFHGSVSYYSKSRNYSAIFKNIRLFKLVYNGLISRVFTSDYLAFLSPFARQQETIEREAENNQKEVVILSCNIIWLKIGEFADFPTLVKMMTLCRKSLRLVGPDSPPDSMSVILAKRLEIYRIIQAYESPQYTWKVIMKWGEIRVLDFLSRSIIDESSKNREIDIDRRMWEDFLDKNPESEVEYNYIRQAYAMEDFNAARGKNKPYFLKVTTKLIEKCFSVLSSL